MSELIMSVIGVKNLKKYFGSTKAVDGVSFSVEKGEIFGFLGPNGAGKTTAIRCMMDFIRPDSGRISILGKDAQSQSVALKAKIGYLVSGIYLNDYWTGLDHIKFVEQIRGKSKIVRDLVKEFSYNPRIKVRSLSTGNKQKLGLILALMNEPEILILDEPTAGLDPILQNSVYRITRDFQKKGCTVFMSSHNLPEVEKICDRVAIIKDGKMADVEKISNLKGKKMHNVAVYFNGPVDADKFKLKGVEIVEQMPDGVNFKVKGDINPIFDELAKHSVKNVEISGATLEEIFLEFYQKEK